MRKRLFDVSNTSNLVSFAVLLAGLAGRGAAVPGNGWLVEIGLFALAGGLTNWLAVKMLFDRVPLLYGSGVIPARFREIRAQVRVVVLRHFFDADYLRRYFATQGQGQIPGLEDLRVRLRQVVRSPEVEAAIGGKVDELLRTPLGMVAQLLGAERIKAQLAELIEAAAVASEQPIRRALADLVPDPQALRDQVDRLVSAKLEELTPEAVKRMMEEVIRRHLGWLVLWGNVFGGLIGLITAAVRHLYP